MIYSFVDAIVDVENAVVEDDVEKIVVEYDVVEYDVVEDDVVEDNLVCKVLENYTNRQTWQKNTYN